MADNEGARRRAGRRGLWICAGVAAAGAVAAVLGIWYLPDWMYPGSGTEVVQAQAVLQGGLLTAAAALTAVAGALIALDETRQANSETKRANEAADVRERAANLNTHVRELYVEAAKLLNDPGNLGIHLAGIYALERIAVDSPADQRTVVEVLSAFVRVHSTDPALRTTTPDPATPVRPAVDVHAAVTVLARLPIIPGVPRADLAGADLTGPAALHRLQAPHCSLTNTRLDGADLTDAVLRRATLTDAWLGGATLTRAQLDGATLTRAQLGAADLTNAGLFGADLTNAQGLVQGQVDAARGDGGTRLPAGLVRPASWGPEV